MEKPGLNDRLKERLHIYLNLDLKSRKEIAAAVRQNVKTIYNWETAGFTLDKARRLARAVGLAEQFFTDPPEVFNDTDPMAYLSADDHGAMQRSIGFTGRTTHALAAFLEYNAGLLDQTLVRIAAFGTPVLTLPGHLLTSQVAGYQRSLVVPDVGGFGGSNAVIEDFRIARLDILLPPGPVALKTPNRAFPCPTDAFLRQNGPAMVQFLADSGLTMETLHVCARSPGSQSFSVLMGLMDQHRRDFVLMECALDALKAFVPHFVSVTQDAARAHAFLHRFIHDMVRLEEAAQAVCYAIEALPFCAFPGPSQRIAMTRLAEAILAGRGRFSLATPDMRLAASVARAYLPFVTSPEEFEHIPFAWFDAAPG